MPGRSHILAPVVLAGLVLVSLLPGCHSRMQTPYDQLSQGEYGHVREAVHGRMTDNRRDRRYLLDRMRAGILTLADGHAESAEGIFEESYDLLRTHGINEDRTVAAVALHEGVQIWKGEPFEQAMAMAYYGLMQASVGAWDNLRAAADNSLFYLRDFGEDDDGQRLDTHAIARRSLEYERARDAGATHDEATEAADFLEHGYVRRASNFTLGYLLRGIANQQLGRTEEASDNFLRVEELEPALEELVDAFRAGRYNTVLVVSWGLGPEKQGYGPDNALARFAPRFASDRAQLAVRVGEHEVRRYRQVQDINAMARDHMWNNLEDVRIAKSFIGQGMMVGGLVATDIGMRRGSTRTTLAGLGVLATGGLMRAGAHVDTRYCDVMPQRVYVVPLNLDENEQSIMVQLDGAPSSRIRLRGLKAPDGHEAQLRYVRLVSRRNRTSSPPPWADSGRVYYSNPYTRRTDEPQLPYILSGPCARPPSERAMRDYRDDGNLTGMTLGELERLHHAEGLFWREQDEGGYASRHVLEGGRSLVSPLPGTAGFARLFGQRHEPYTPRSGELRDAKRKLERERE